MKKSLFVLFLSVVSMVSYTQPGTPDPTFGAGGIVTTSIGTVSNIRSMAIQADGKIVVAGLSHTGGDKDFGLTRYNIDGTLDNSFDGDGKVITTISAGFDNIALCIAIQGDGKILVAGYTNTATDADFAIARYNSNGSLDNSFDGDGVVITSFGPANTASIHGMIIQTDGKILVAGLAYSGTDNDFALARYNTDGTPDLTFDGDGNVLTPMGIANDAAYAIILQPDGKIVLAGICFTSSIDFALARYNADGSLDNTFDGDGKVTTDIGSNADFAYSLAIQTDGKLVVAGQSSDGSDNDFALARYNTDGSPDNSFDGDGKLTSPIGPFNDVAYAVALQADGKIVTAGSCETISTNNDFALARYNTNGSLDNSFSGDAKVITDINGFDHGFAMKLSGLRIYVGGVSNNDISTIVAYQNDASPLLPLYLTGFSAHKQENNILLSWETASEQNTSHFEIERSGNGTGFQKIGQIQAAGNSNFLKTYFFTDRQPLAGTNVYRLKKSDADSRFTYSKVVIVKMNSLAEVEIFPNPVQDLLQVQVNTSRKGNIVLQVQDPEGRIIRQLTISSMGNQVSTFVDVALLSKGIYFLLVNTGNATIMKKFIKQ